MPIVKRWSIVGSCLVATLAVTSHTALAQPQRNRTSAAVTSQKAPADLRPLLEPRHSEMRLVLTRYTADHALLITDYAGGTRNPRDRRGGPSGRDGARPGARTRGDGVAQDPAKAVVISPRRIARLKRFDLSWQAALDKIDASTLSPEGQADLAKLRSVIDRDLKALDAQTATLSEISPLIPFSPELVSLIEARIEIEDVDAESAAGTLTNVTRAIADIRSKLASGTLTANATQATRAADAVDQLRDGLAYWNTFYNGYDPLFTWWVELPYKHADSSLQAYATFLRKKIAPAKRMSNLKVVALQIDPSPAPARSGVPHLQEIISLPQDEMAGIARRFLEEQGLVRRRGDDAKPVSHDSSYYNGWLGALQKLDFDQLSRNAQVDYLYVKYLAELGRSRIGKPLPTKNPRRTDDSGIPGPARGREGLIRDLQDVLIPYRPEELITLAEREFAWCVEEMKKASREMGYGDDWKQALEKTKTMHPPPGGQPAMIRDLLTEAVDYLIANDMVTVPQVDREAQHMIMMTPERQLVNPFFTGGAQMSVSFPTNTMEFDARQQSMRGNNRPWSHATAFHEMIPGHNLTGYYSQRYADYRPPLGGGPFWGEGWPVYWELTMYELGFHDTPEERVGALFWRMHRCARIIFSLKFHMGQWSPQEAVDFLVDSVGHERENAIAEVRRSFDPSAGYGPLYQAGYLLGAMQLRGLRKELVDSKEMPQKEFHDEILRQGSMPIALLRLALTKEKLTRDMPIAWEFSGNLANDD